MFCRLTEPNPPNICAIFPRHRAVSGGLQLGNLFNKMFVKQLPEQNSIAGGTCIACFCF